MTTGIAIFPTEIGNAGSRGTTTRDPIGDAAIQSEMGIRDDLLRRHPDGTELDPPSLIQAAMDRMVRLLAGESKDDLKDLVVDFGDASDFSRQVWEATRTVGPGETTTYGEIAKQIGQPHAAREVGQALGRNPVPIVVPCHRVLGAGGKLVGFSAPGGVTTKTRMLHLEGAAFEGQPALF